MRRLLAQRAPTVALVFVCLMVVVALMAQWIAPRDPLATNFGAVNAGPSAEFWLGTDDIGRDIFSRLAFAGRVSLLAATQAVLIAMLLGVPLGLVSGYFGGWTDIVVMRITDTLMSFPGLVLAITIIGFIGPSLTNAMIAIGIVFSPRFIRVVRASTLSVREEVYIEAARMIGCPPGMIIRRHVLPNILSPLIVQATLTMALAILAEASLSFLGLGVQPPDASWGSMLGRAWRFLTHQPFNVFAPGLLIMFTVLALNVLGDGIRDSLGRERHGG